MKQKTSERRLILGHQAVTEAIRVRARELDEVLIEERPGKRAAATERFALDHEVTVRHVPRRELERLSGGTLHQGVAAYGPHLELIDEEDLLGADSLLAIALDGIVDPQNFGAVVRSAVALCRAPIIWPENTSAPLTPTTFRASAGAIEHATLCRVRSLPGFLRDAALRGHRVVGLAPDGDRALHEVDLSGPTILVLGSEHAGMGRAVRRTCTDIARLVMPGTIQSLNASVAAGIALYSAAAQRR